MFSMFFQLISNCNECWTSGLAPVSVMCGDFSVLPPLPVLHISSMLVVHIAEFLSTY